MSIVSEKAEKQFPSHTEIGMEVQGRVHCHGFFSQHQHNRETLDDLIYDLCAYRDALPATSDYILSGRI